MSTHAAPYRTPKTGGPLEKDMGPVSPAAVIKLAWNENPFGASRRAVAAARAALAGAHRYPDAGSGRLRKRLAEHLGVSERQVLVGSGSTEVIGFLVQAFCGNGEEVLAPACSFACYRLSAQAHGRAYREAPNGAGFAYDLDALAAAVTPATRLVFLANPNNPTGACAGRAALERLLDALPPAVVLAVDEAYFEYVLAGDHPDAIRYLARRERLVAVRTFSKIHGLAGLRVGYAVASEELIRAVERVRLPFNVSAAGEAAACAALDDPGHVERSRTANAAGRSRLGAVLRSIGLEVAPSEGNFLLAGLPRSRGGAGVVHEALLQRGVIVRPLAEYGLPDHLRITVGRPAESARLVAALREALGGPRAPRP